MCHGFELEPLLDDGLDLLGKAEQRPVHRLKVTGYQALKFSAEGGTMFIHGEYTYHVFTKTGDNTLTVKGNPHKIEWVIFGGVGGYAARGGSGAVLISYLTPK